MLVGGWEPSTLALVTGSSASFDDEDVHRPEVDKSMSALLDNVEDVVC